MKKGSEIRIYILVIMSVLLLLANSCENKDDSTTDTITDKQFYSYIGYSLVSCYVDIYNQNLAGHSTGAQNITANGPMGGTVIITGNTGYSSNTDITTTDLLFSMTSIKYTSNSNGFLTQITLTGATTYTGSFSDSYTSVNHQSNNLHIKGSVTYKDIVRNIDNTGIVSMNRSEAAITATIFGNTVAW